MSDSTGYRKVVNLGNTNHNNWTIKGLAGGTYYWSVQTLDNNFAGSNFSSEQTFTITLSTQGTLQGYVVDGTYKTPIVGLNISIGGWSGTTNGVGFYSIGGVTAGSYTMSVGGLTINNIPIIEGETTTQNFWINKPEPLYVLNTSNAGPGSMRQAIEDANFSTHVIDKKYRI